MRTRKQTYRVSVELRPFSPVNLRKRYSHKHVDGAFVIQTFKRFPYKYYRWYVIDELRGEYINAEEFVHSYGYDVSLL